MYLNVLPHSHQSPPEMACAGLYGVTESSFQVKRDLRTASASLSRYNNIRAQSKFKAVKRLVEPLHQILDKKSEDVYSGPKDYEQMKQFHINRMSLKMKHERFKMEYRNSKQFRISEQRKLDFTRPASTLSNIKVEEEKREKAKKNSETPLMNEELFKEMQKKQKEVDERILRNIFNNPVVIVKRYSQNKEDKDNQKMTRRQKSLG